MKKTYYFSHDFNARNDPKLVDLQIKHGMSGLGIYWCIIEMLYEQDGKIQTEYDRIAFVLRTEKSVIQSVINDFDLFVIGGDGFYSESVNKRLGIRNDKSVKATESVNKRWKKYERNTNVSKSDTIKERKGKEIKGNESNNARINSEENLTKEFSNQFTLIENLSRLTKTSPDKIKSLIPEFILTLASKNRLDDPFKDQWDYFVNWYKSELKNQKQLEPEKPRAGFSLSSYGKEKK